MWTIPLIYCNTVLYFKRWDKAMETAKPKKPQEKQNFIMILEIKFAEAYVLQWLFNPHIP